MNNEGGGWAIYIWYLCFFRTTRVHNPNGKSVFSHSCTARGGLLSGMPGHVLSLNNCPFAWSIWPHLIHASSPPESITQMMSRSVQLFLHSSHRAYLYFTMGCPFPFKIAHSHGPHRIQDSLGPSEPTTQTAFPSVQPFWTDDCRISLYFTVAALPLRIAPLPWRDVDPI